MYNRQDLKRYASFRFTQQYWPLVGVCALMLVISAIASNTGILGMLVSGPLQVGLCMYCLRIWRSEEASVSQMFDDGFSNYGRVLGGMLLTGLYTALWSLLFIIPGIVKAHAYAMVPYLLGDCKNVTATDAIKLSMRMMQGHKFELFLLHLSFFGWHLLSALTLGLLHIFYVTPYLNMALAGYYAFRKEAALAEGTITLEELNGAPIV